MAYVNLPGVFPEKQDGGFAILATSNAPRVLVLGTASKGFAETPYLVGRTQEAAVTFGTSGTLVRGMYETKSAGAENVILFRIGATAAVLEGIGHSTETTGNITIETATKDDSAGTDYSMYWDSTVKRLVVKNVSSDVVVYDRDFDNPEATIDRGEVYVSGSPDASDAVDIGSASDFLTLAAAGADPTNKVTYTAGTDGTSPSRMKLYELLYKAYRDLENEDFDIVVPMDVYLDDLNVMDMAAAEVTTRSLASVSDYPTTDSDQDVLGKVYVEEYQGLPYFWWWLPSDPDSPDFSGDGGANIYPSVGSASATTKADGTDLAASDFHEVNFAYQLANFCYSVSGNENDCHGVIGVRPPVSISLSDVNLWIGTSPTYTTDADGNQTVSDSAYDGTGLLGNKFMAGACGFRSSVAGGGFIATDTGFLDGTEQEDRGGHKIDIGAYISVVGAWATLFNAFATSGLGYTVSGAATYGGFFSSLDPKSAPTNKVISPVTLPFRINNQKLDALAGAKYVFFRDKPKGTVVADAPTAARADSDYRRLTTVRIVKEVIDAIRTVADQFIGEAGGAAQRAALQTACEGALGRLQKGGYIQRYDMSITATAAQQVQGDATIELTIVPAFELRQITLVLSLAAQ